MESVGGRNRDSFYCSHIVLIFPYVAYYSTEEMEMAVSSETSVISTTRRYIPKYHIMNTCGGIAPHMLKAEVSET